MIVASCSTVVAFVLLLVNNDCQALGKDPNRNPLQVSTIQFRIHVSKCNNMLVNLQCINNFSELDLKVSEIYNVICQKQNRF